MEPLSYIFLLKEMRRTKTKSFTWSRR